MFAAEITPPTSPTRISNISNLELEIWQPEGYTRRLSPAARDRDTPRGFLFGNAGAAARWLGGPRRLALLLIHPSYSSTASYSRTNQPIPELQVHSADVSDAREAADAVPTASPRSER